MDKYSKLTSIYGRIWFTASFINAVISTLLMLSFGLEGIFFVFFLTLMFSFILSIPVLLTAMLIASLILSLKVKQNVFELVLAVTFIVSIAGAVFFKGFLSDISENPFPLCAAVVISAVAAVFIFQRKLKAIDVE